MRAEQLHDLSCRGDKWKPMTAGDGRVLHNATRNENLGLFIALRRDFQSDPHVIHIS